MSHTKHIFIEMYAPYLLLLHSKLNKKKNGKFFASGWTHKVVW